MKRIALVLATAGMIVFGVAAPPAQAHEFGWGGHQWRQHSWQSHHDWRRAPFRHFIVYRPDRGHHYR